MPNSKLKIFYSCVFTILIFLAAGTASAQDITSGLVGHWTFDEGSGTVAGDSSGLGNTGTLTNGPVWGVGKVGGALSFDGSNDYIDAGSNAILDDMSVFSFSAWINPGTGAYGPQGTIVQKGHGDIQLTYEGWILAFYPNAPTQLTFRAVHQTNHLLIQAPPNVFTMNEWQHVVVTWDGSPNASGVKIFRNGVEVSYSTQQNGSGPKVSDVARNFLIGINSYVNTPFKGSLDDVRIYNRALSSTDIQALYALGSGPPPSDT
ncbi:MAG: hypothetical protein COU90_03515, partial [Candidatus Ryanbacteria bacterium CG10_big_fil_rev_8_21_14_0_10_43_42]